MLILKHAITNSASVATNIKQYWRYNSIRTFYLTVLLGSKLFLGVLTHIVCVYV